MADFAQSDNNHFLLRHASLHLLSIPALMFPSVTTLMFVSTLFAVHPQLIHSTHISAYPCSGLHRISTSGIMTSPTIYLLRWVVGVMQTSQSQLYWGISPQVLVVDQLLLCWGSFPCRIFTMITGNGVHAILLPFLKLLSLPQFKGCVEILL